MRLRIGRGFGIPVYLHWTFFLLPLWVLYSQPSRSDSDLLLAFTVVPLVFVCVVLHEFGHALAARYFGIGTHDITLYPIGGVARLKKMSERPFEEFVIAVAGPAVNVVIGIVLGLMLAPLLVLRTQWVIHSFPGQVLMMVCAINVLMVPFNLLPAFPMDGGRVLRSMLSAWLGFFRGTQIAVGVGMCMAVLLAAAGVFLLGNYMLVIIAVFVFFAGQQELAAARYREQQRYVNDLQSPLEALPVRPLYSVPAVPTATSVFALQPKISVYTWDSHTGLWRQDPSPSA